MKVTHTLWWLQRGDTYVSMPFHVKGIDRETVAACTSNVLSWDLSLLVGVRGAAFEPLKDFSDSYSHVVAFTLPLVLAKHVSELHVSSFTFCTLSSKRLLPFWFLLFNLHLSYRIRERTRLCVQLHLQRELSPSASVIQPLLFKPARGETRAYAVSHSLYVGSDCNGFQQYRQGFLI